MFRLITATREGLVQSLRAKTNVHVMKHVIRTGQKGCTVARDNSCFFPLKALSQNTCKSDSEGGERRYGAAPAWATTSFTRCCALSARARAALRPSASAPRALSSRRLPRMLTNCSASPQNDEVRNYSPLLTSFCLAILRRKF